MSEKRCEAMVKGRSAASGIRMASEDHHLDFPSSAFRAVRGLNWNATRSSEASFAELTAGLKS